MNLYLRLHSPEKKPLTLADRVVPPRGALVSWREGDDVGALDKPSDSIEAKGNGSPQARTRQELQRQVAISAQMTHSQLEPTITQ